MFENAQLGRSLDRETYQQREPGLREALLDAQFRLAAANFSVVVVVAGVEGSGKGETVNLLLDWMDARGIETHALGKPSEGEKERPEFYRYWKRLPPKGRLGIFFGSWYTRPISQHSLGELEDVAFEDSLRRIQDFERMLEAEGVLLVKLWLHIDKKQQKKRFQELESHPDTAWRVTRKDWRYHKSYEEFTRSASRALRRTHSAGAPWEVVEAWDSRYRHLRAAEVLLEAIEARLARPSERCFEKPPLPEPVQPNILSRLDLSLKAAPEARKQMRELQWSIGRRFRQLRKRDRSLVIVFEGCDAAGKGGAIRRILHGLDARFYQVIQVSAPSPEERARPYLWRFWRCLPRHGHLTIFDRSWYGRVLVERLEGFCSPHDWQRAYSEINDFEEQLVESGCGVLKFWLSISPEEQLRRFQEREATGFKRYKITDEDWRNREKWGGYEAAACDMIEHTSSDLAPWTLVEAEDKDFARLKVLQTVHEHLREVLKKE